MTGPRKAVLDRIAVTDIPFTAEDLCDWLPGIGRATVFRTVKLLQEMDVVCRVPLEDGSVRYQRSRGEHHHHLVCSECNTVAEFTNTEIDALIRREAVAAGFALQSHSLELYGVCEKCRG